MSGGVLNEAYERFRSTGPEWGEDHLTNHGPMVAEVLVRRGNADLVDRWVDAYAQRLDELPGPTDRVTDDNWRAALGAGSRVGDWSAYFANELAEHPWREVLAAWWPRLLPGILAGTTHGVIRVGHVVRVLQIGAESETTLTELAHGLAFWASNARNLPVTVEPAGTLDPAQAVPAIARVPSQSGRVADRLGQLPTLTSWHDSVAALRPATTPEEARTRLTELVAAATEHYLGHGHGSPVLLVHTATAPNAVLHLLPVLPRELWIPSLNAAWATTAAIIAGYAPPEGAPRTALPTVAPSSDAAANALDRAFEHGDEHVIKFTDTAAEVYTRTGSTDALAAAARIADLIPGNS